MSCMTASELPNFWDSEVFEETVQGIASKDGVRGMDSEFLRVVEIVGDFEKAAWLESSVSGLIRLGSILWDGTAIPVVDARNPGQVNFFDFDIVLIETISGDRLAIAILSTARILRIALKDNLGYPNVIAEVSVRSMKRLKILHNNLVILLSLRDLLTETKGAFVWR